MRAKTETRQATTLYKGVPFIGSLFIAYTCECMLSQVCRCGGDDVV